MLVTDLFEIIWIDGDTFEKSWALVKKRKTKTLSLVDATILLTAKEMDAIIFSFDEDFKKEGAKVLPEVVEM